MYNNLNTCDIEMSGEILKSMSFLINFESISKQFYKIVNVVRNPI